MIPTSYENIVTQADENGEKGIEIFQTNFSYFEYDCKLTLQRKHEYWPNLLQEAPRRALETIKCA